MDLDLSNSDHMSSTMNSDTFCDFDRRVKAFDQRDGLEFESWLTSFHLPDMTAMPRTSPAEMETLLESLGARLSKNARIEKIWKLYARDHKDHPVSDELIARFARNLQVEELDWWKLDLDIEPLFVVARNEPAGYHLRKIDPYSSGSWVHSFIGRAKRAWSSSQM